MKSSFDPTMQHTDVDSKIVVSLERISEAFRVMLWNENKKHKLSPAQLQFLVFLLFHAEGQCTVSNLANEFNLTQATVSDAVSTLEKKVLVRRIKSETDRRVSLLHLTAEGKAVASDACHFSDDLRQCVSELDENTKMTTMKALMKVIVRLQERGVISSDRMCLTCRYFDKMRPDGNPYFCNLVQAPLAEGDLRVDCPEHDARKA